MFLSTNDIRICLKCNCEHYFIMQASQGLPATRHLRSRPDPTADYLLKEVTSAHQPLLGLLTSAHGMGPQPHNSLKQRGPIKVTQNATTDYEHAQLRAPHMRCRAYAASQSLQSPEHQRALRLNCDKAFMKCRAVWQANACVS